MGTEESVASRRKRLAILAPAIGAVVSVTSTAFLASLRLINPNVETLVFPAGFLAAGGVAAAIGAVMSYLALGIALTLAKHARTRTQTLFFGAISVLSTATLVSLAMLGFTNPAPSGAASTGWIVTGTGVLSGLLATFVTFRLILTDGARRN